MNLNTTMCFLVQFQMPLLQMFPILQFFFDLNFVFIVYFFQLFSFLKYNVEILQLQYLSHYFSPEEIVFTAVALLTSFHLTTLLNVIAQ